MVIQPYGDNAGFMFMAFKIRNPFYKVEDKTVPAVSRIDEQSRQGVHKEVIPNFLYKPPFGYPRYVDLPNIRILSATPYVDMCITTIIDEVCSIEWDIIAEDETGNPIEGKDNEKAHVKAFFDNPNTNKESWEYITRVFLRDVLETDSGVIVKVFNRYAEMVEIVARDGITFTKNPDMHGMMTYREDLIFNVIIDNVENIPENEELLRQAQIQAGTEYGHISQWDAREQAAYFQYGWITGARPIPFGKKEIVWFERNPRSDSRYGRGAVEILQSVVQTLIYAIEHNLDYFSDNSIPPGVLGLEDSDAEEIEAFKEQWLEQQRIKDNTGKWKKLWHHLPIVGKIPKFQKLGFTNAELQLLEGQRWWSKLVWACFGVTPTELGFTEDAKGMANQIVQTNIFKKRAINPLLRMIEYKVNTEILSEFGYEGLKFKYKRFDVDEETKKAELYKILTDVGIKTVNEIRREEGLDDVEWGDKDPKRNQGTNFFPFGQNPEEGEQERMEEESGAADREKKKKKKEEQKDIETKPFAGYSNFADCVKKNQSKKDPEAYCASIKRKVEGKAMGEDNPLIPKEGEQMDEDKLKRVITYLLKQNEKKLISLLEREGGEDQLINIKDVNDVIKALKALLGFEGLRQITNEVMKNEFIKGWDDAERQLDRNFMVNKGAITFIQDHTFNNIKGMTDEIAEDLRQELERGIIAGEGIAKLKNRVADVFDVGEVRAEAIARTETNRAEGQGRLQAWKSSGETDYMKKWVTHFDDQTSAICKRLDGQTVGIHENFTDKTTGWAGPTHPAHVNCRSTVIYVYKEEKKDFIEQYKKDKEDVIERVASKEFDIIKEKEKKDLEIKEKELEIQKRKESLLKKFEEDIDG